LAFERLVHFFMSGVASEALATRPQPENLAISLPAVLDECLSDLAGVEVQAFRIAVGGML
jgi:hypothetical protein